ncbi:MAG: 4Fe-4S binding protein [Bacteroidetes bacterium GWA2_31_9]|nr:MAG: 4Fe-4S binding protein [Bacteroidetes bacterium GWA2_31_9]
MPNKKVFLKVSLPSFLITFGLLSIVQIKSSLQMIIAERFFHNGGWVEIFVLSFYSGFLAYKMSNQKNTAKWRMYSWLLFSIVFYGQLTLGLLGFEKFLLTGSLHVPVPAIILAGPIYRFEFAIMPILFLSTIILSGPSWCSHLCYFGGIDNVFSNSKKYPIQIPIKNKIKWKYSFLAIIIAFTILLRIVNIPPIYAAGAGIALGIIGLLIMAILSSKRKKMIHCTVFCPIGTLVMYLKFINPFRIKINSSCTSCMLCAKHCKYDALNKEDIESGKPGLTCTYCGDCITTCKFSSIEYKFPGLTAINSRLLYIIITVSLHATFLGLGMI